MKAGNAVACMALAGVLSLGCNATSRRDVLALFFDGVPPLNGSGASEEKAGQANGTEAREAAAWAHGPYAAKLCKACHESTATNALVAPRAELCFRCHE